MFKFFLDIYYTCKSELKAIIRDEAIIILFLLVPFGYPLLYTYIYNNEVSREVKMIALDESHSALGREFVRKVDATPDVHIIGYAGDMEEAKEYMRRKEAYGILYIPGDFSKNLHTQKQTQVNVYADMSALLFYKAMVLSTTEVSLDMGADIRVSEVGYKSRGDDANTQQAVLNEWVPLYNPANGFASFLIPAVLILILQQTMLLGIATRVGTQNDRRIYSIGINDLTGKKVGSLGLTFGKAVCYVLLYMLISIWVIRIVPYLFDLPQIGEPSTIAIFIMPFLLASAFFGITLSYFCSQREFAMPLFVFTSVIFVFLSGISWPWASMPPMLKSISYIIPSTPAIQGFVRINTMGASLGEVWFEYIALWVQAIVYCVTGILMQKWWYKNYSCQHIKTI